MKLYSYYRSSCSWRVRIALNLKEIPYEIIPVNLLKGEQNSSDYLEVNPSGLVPTLVLQNGSQLGQSIAILEYLEEAYPNSPLLPKDPLERAKVRQAVMIVAADTQPLQNLRILQKLFPEQSQEEQKKSYAIERIDSGLKAFSKVTQPGKYCFGDAVTLADCVLIPQLYNARRFGIDVEQSFPILNDIEKNLQQLEAFIQATPEHQSDYPN